MMNVYYYEKYIGEIGLIIAKNTFLPNKLIYQLISISY
jgi:hypothetical protein